MMDLLVEYLKRGISPNIVWHCKLMEEKYKYLED